MEFSQASILPILEANTLVSPVSTPRGIRSRQNHNLASSRLDTRSILFHSLVRSHRTCAKNTPLRLSHQFKCTEVEDGKTSHRLALLQKHALSFQPWIAHRNSGFLPYSKVFPFVVCSNTRRTVNSSDQLSTLSRHLERL